MQDPRIRIAIAAVLSLAAFVSIQGAVAVFLWWLVFTRKMQLVKRVSLVFSLILMIAFFSIILELFEGHGLSYFIRMTVIVIIGMWFYVEQKPGEFLGVCVWLLGNKTGFEIGMTAEMGLQSLSIFNTDFERICLAQKIKGMKWGVQSLVPAGLVLVHGALTRAENTAELLAVRGYQSGGTMCPEFSPKPVDIVAGIIATGVLFFALMPISEFFILYR